MRIPPFTPNPLFADPPDEFLIEPVQREDILQDFASALKASQTTFSRLADHAEQRRARKEEFNVLQRIWHENPEALFAEENLVPYHGESPSPRTTILNYSKKVPLWEHTAVRTPDVDFFHASHIHTPHQHYIASTLPHAYEANNFWKLIVEHKVSTIVSLLETNPHYRIDYLPTKTGNKLLLDEGRFVECVKNVQIDDYLHQRFLHLVDPVQGSIHEVVHLHYCMWPDGNPPIEDPDDFLELIHHINDSLEGREGPLLIHCLAGIGRTGTLITIHSALRAMESAINEKIHPDAIPINLLERIHNLRRQRWGMVASPDQYAYAWEVLSCQQERLLGKADVIEEGML